MKLEFPTHIFRKHRSIKFHENPSSGSRYRHTRQTDARRQTWQI